MEGLTNPPRRWTGQRSFLLGRDFGSRVFGGSVFGGSVFGGGAGGGLRRVGGTEYDRRRALLVFRRQPHAVAGEIDGHAVRLSSRLEAQRAPVNRDLAAAYAEKAADVDDRRPHLA